MVDMSFSPEAFSDSFPGFSPGQGGGDAPSTPSENFDLQSAIDAGAAAAAAAEAEAYARAGSDTALNDYLTGRAAQQQYDIEPEEAVRSFADTEDIGKGGIFSNIKGFLTGKVADVKANPIPTIARTASSLVLGSGPLGILATGVGRAFWDMMTFGRTGAMLEKGMTMDEINKQYAQEQADYISDAEANVDGPYIPPAATATQTQSQSSIPPRRTPTLAALTSTTWGAWIFSIPLVTPRTSSPRRTT